MVAGGSVSRMDDGRSGPSVEQRRRSRPQGREAHLPGIGSEGYGALSLGRKFIGSELKESYFNQACQNLTGAGAQLEFSLA